MKKIVITGPESSGKSTLAKHLSESLFIPHVREYAREFIDQLNRNYIKDDLIAIAKGQIELEKDVLSQTPSFLLCDTDLLTLKVWSEYKYGNCDGFIINSLKNNLPDMYFLCVPDIPWKEDEQRENPDDRDVLFKLYKKEIQQVDVPYFVLKGNETERLHEAMSIL